jgi:hypothetical protein
MNEYELTDAIATYTSLTYMNDAAFIAITSAYVAVAYMVGDKLSRFQVSFITFLFLGLQIPSAVAIGGYLSRILSLIERLDGLDARGTITPGDDTVITSIYLLFRCFAVIGCMIFMWQIRHPKTT